MGIASPPSFLDILAQNIFFNLIVFELVQKPWIDTYTLMFTVYSGIVNSLLLIIFC